VNLIKRILLILVSIALLSALLYFSDITKIAEIISGANLSYIALGLVLWVAGLFLRTIRWSMLLKKISIAPNFLDTMKVFIAGMFISNITPGKVGDPVRSVILKKRCGYSVGTSLPSVFIERISDVITTVFISIIGLLFLLGASQMSSWIVGIIFFYLIVISFGIFLFSSKIRTKKFFSKIFSIFSFISSLKKFESKISEFSENMHDSFIMYNDKKLLLLTFVNSMIIWIIEGLILFVSFSALNIEVPILAAVVIVPITSLIAILTFLPGGLGSGEVISVLLFTSMFTIGLAEVTSAIIVSRLLSFWIYIVLGSVIISTMKYRFNV